MAPEPFGGHGGLFEVLRTFVGQIHSTSLNYSLNFGLWPGLRPKIALFLQFSWLHGQNFESGLARKIYDQGPKDKNKKGFHFCAYLKSKSASQSMTWLI